MNFKFDFEIELELDRENSYKETTQNNKENQHCSKEKKSKKRDIANSKKEIISLLDSDSLSTDIQTDHKFSDDHFEIHLPQKLNIHRMPGAYEDLSSEYKKKHNNMIYKYSSLLKDKITALILDGKKMRTSKALMKSKDHIERIHIIEINAITFNLMKNNLKNFHNGEEKIQIYNSHIMDYVLRGVDPNTNLIYLDVMCNYFDSNKTKGTQGIVIELFKQLKKTKILFAATFCLRNSSLNNSFNEEVEEILINLKDMFQFFEYNYVQLNKKSEMRYKGQAHMNYGMMFAIFILENKNLENDKLNIIIEI